jgi:hypothetical protein
MLSGIFISLLLAGLHFHRHLLQQVATIGIKLIDSFKINICINLKK